MIGVMLLALALVRIEALRTRPDLLSAALLACTWTAFVLSARAVAFGAEGAVHWEALAATAPFVLLLASSAKRTTAVGAATWLVLGMA